MSVEVADIRVDACCLGPSVFHGMPGLREYCRMDWRTCAFAAHKEGHAVDMQGVRVDQEHGLLVRL